MGRKNSVEDNLSPDVIANIESRYRDRLTRDAYGDLLSVKPDVIFVVSGSDMERLAVALIGAAKPNISYDDDRLAMMQEAIEKGIKSAIDGLRVLRRLHEQHGWSAYTCEDVEEKIYENRRKQAKDGIEKRQQR